MTRSSDLIRVLPEVLLGGFAILIMVFEPFVPARRKSLLGWFALFGIISAGAGAVWMSQQMGLAFSGSVSADHFSLYFIYLFLLIAALTILGSIQYLEREGLSQGEFYALTLLATLGMCLMASSLDLILIFLGLETASISTYILAGYRKHDRRSNEASLKYFLLGSFATAFFLYGIAFVYGLSGTTNLVDLHNHLIGPGANSTFATVALLLMFVGLGFKVSTAPFQIWTPDVYQGAPAPVSAFLSVGPKAAAFAVMLRLFLGGMANVSHITFWLLWLSAILTMCLGNLAALWQSNVKRMLAYSSIAHAGYVLVGLAAGSADGRSAVMFYLFAYALMNAGAFLLVAQLAGEGEQRVEIKDFTGLGRSSPSKAAVLTVLLLSLSGIPATAGFFGKFLLFRAAVDSHLIGLTIVAVINSVISVYYYFHVIVVMYMQEGPTEVTTARAPTALWIALTVSVMGIFYLGIFPDNFLLISNLASTLLPR